MDAVRNVASPFLKCPPIGARPVVLQNRLVVPVLPPEIRLGGQRDNPLGASFGAAQDWYPLIEHFQFRLSPFLEEVQVSRVGVEGLLGLEQALVKPKRHDGDDTQVRVSRAVPNDAFTLKGFCLSSWDIKCPWSTTPTPQQATADIFVLGAEGTGKTSFLNLLAGRDPHVPRHFRTDRVSHQNISMGDFTIIRGRNWAVTSVKVH